MYDFVYVGDECDYTRYPMQDISASLENVYCCMPPEYNVNSIFFSLCKFHNSSRFTSRGIKLPLRTIWKKYILDKETLKKLLDSGNDKCFIFTADGAKYIEMGALDYLRSVFPGCITVCMFHDKVDLYKMRRGFSLDKLKSDFDFVSTYDKNDAEKYDMLSEPPEKCNYSNVPVDESIPESDLFFVGRMKINAPDRLDQLISLYELASRNGLKCDFYVDGVTESKQKYKDVIHYNTVIPYQEALKHVKRTKAVVYLSQNNIAGLTLRDFESIGMGKMLITNNPTIEHTSFFNPALYIPLCYIEQQICRISFKTIYDNKWNNCVVYNIQDWNLWIEKLKSSQEGNNE